MTIKEKHAEAMNATDLTFDKLLPIYYYDSIWIVCEGYIFHYIQSFPF